MASTSSATKSFITRCLSLSKAASKKPHNFITSSPRKIPHTVASTSSATKSFITRCLSLPKAHYFYCIKIRALYRTSPMFLWEIKNTIISQNLRELCVIKTNTKNPHTMASTSSSTNYFITRCLSLPKAHYFYCIKIRALYRTSLMFLWELNNAIISQNLRELCVIKANTKIPHTVASTSSATNSFITRCLSVAEGKLFLLH